MTRRCLFFLILFLIPVVSQNAIASELVLSPQFHLAEKRQLPSRITFPGVSFREISYPDFDAVEWQVMLDAPATGELPLYENLRSADFVAEFPKKGDLTLHWNNGSHAADTDFRPHAVPLALRKMVELESFGGRSSDGVLPYFNISSDTGGLIVAIGWSGDWRASFESLGDGKLQIMAGLKRSRFKLQPGEHLRLPAMLVMSYQGSWIHGQNQFRRLSLQHFTPRNHPPLKLMPVAASVHGMLGFNVTSEQNLTTLANDIAALKLPLDTYWLDAGWNEGGFPAAQGNPQSDPIRFPRGLGPLGECVQATGMRFLVWFEPERAMRGTWVDREHPSWLISPSQTPPHLKYMENDGFKLLDLGNPAAHEWAVDSVSQHIQEAKISIYRQDFNEYPSYFWHTDEADDEIGLREVRYINGLYQFLDNLMRRHPHLILDNCASGGRRIDFEMMRRSVVLWRSDSCWDAKTYPRNVQAMTHGLSHWLPMHGLGSVATTDVALRSGMGACASFAINYRDPTATSALRQHLDRYLKIRPLFAKDFYPLTDWSDDPTTWLAFQFHDPQSGQGVVQAFRRNSTQKALHTLKLQALDPQKRYDIQNWDNLSEYSKKSGSELLRNGIDLHLPVNSDSAIVLHYTPES